MQSAQGSGRLAGKVALVTGGGTSPGELNIGHAIGLELIAEGASVAVLDRDPEAAAHGAAALSARGGHAVPVLADVADERACAQAVEDVMAAFGRLDVLVNNCAIVGPSHGIDEVSEDAIDLVFGVNVKGPLFMTRHALKRLADGGSIVNLSSIAATRPGAGSVYPMSKGAVETLTRLTAVKAGPRGIRVNAVAPGTAWTPNAWRAMPEDRRKEARELFRRSSLLGVEGTASDVAAAVVFLAWAPWISGQVLTVDGGGSLMRPT